MRTVALVTVSAVLAGVFCGGKPAASTARWPKESAGALTEADIALFVRLLPTLSAALKAGHWQMAPFEADQGPGAFLTGYVEGMNIPGVDESLKAAGSNWSTMRLLLYRVFPAMNALKMDEAPPAVVEQLRKDTTAAGRQNLKSFEATQAANARIPRANKQLVSNHLQELLRIQGLGR